MLSGGTLSVAAHGVSNAWIGAGSSKGSVTVTDATFSVGNALVIGDNTNAGGTVTLGGSSTCIVGENLFLGFQAASAVGVLNVQDTATLSIASSLVIGNAGEGRSTNPAVRSALPAETSAPAPPGCSPSPVERSI